MCWLKYAATGSFALLSLAIASGWTYTFVYESYGEESWLGNIVLGTLILLGPIWLALGGLIFAMLVAEQWKFHRVWTACCSVPALIGLVHNFAGFVYISQGV